MKIIKKKIIFEYKRGNCTFSISNLIGQVAEFIEKTKKEPDIIKLPPLEYKYLNYFLMKKEYKSPEKIFGAKIKINHKKQPKNSFFGI